jgi:hypothetical protein
MDHVHNYSSYINEPSSQTYRSYYLDIYSKMERYHVENWAILRTPSYFCHILTWSGGNIFLPVFKVTFTFK